MALFCVAIKSDSVSLYTFPLLNFVLVISCNFHCLALEVFIQLFFFSCWFSWFFIVVFLFDLKLYLLLDSIINISLLFFVCIIQVIELLYPINLQCRLVFFNFLFLSQRVCLCHPSDIRPYLSPSISLFYYSYTCVPILSFLRKVQSFFKWDCLVIYCFDLISAVEFGFENFPSSFLTFCFISVC